MASQIVILDPAARLPRPYVEAIHRTDGPVRAAGSECDAADALAAGVPTLLVVAPGVPDPLATARRVGAGAAELRFLFVVDPAELATFRRRSAYAAPPGGRWSVLTTDSTEFDAALREALARLAQERRFRTTLEQVKTRAGQAPAADAGEYRRLVASDRYLASVLQHAHDAIVSLDPTGRVVSWNRGAELLFGMTREQAQRATFASLFEDPAAVRSAIEDVLAGSVRTTGLGVVQGATLRFVDANFGVVRGEDNEIIGVAAILRDITERHHAEEELRASSRQKDEFLAMLAHELRNPLAPIRNAACILGLTPQPDARARQAVDIIRRQSDHMVGLIGDLLDVARVTRGAVALERTTLPFARLLQDAVEQASGLIEDRGHRLEIVDRCPETQVHVDPKRMTQVIANVLINAAKYMPPGGQITTQLSCEDDEAVLAVTDTGIGMDAELQSRVFDLFVQAERSPDRAEGGLGIGLSLVRSIVTMHGGRVTASSPGIGQGSTFVVRLPQARRPARAPAAVLDTTRAPTPLHLMVVDDNEDAAHTVGILLQSYGHRVDVEIDPRRALEHARETLPDVFILDIGMPHIDGYELARRIRALPAEARRPVLIALTGYGQRSDRERAQLAGFDFHLVKPLEPSALLQTLETAARSLS